MVGLQTQHKHTAGTADDRGEWSITVERSCFWKDVHPESRSKVLHPCSGQHLTPRHRGALEPHAKQL